MLLPTVNPRLPVATATVALALALGLAGCGDSEDSTASTASTASSAPTGTSIASTGAATSGADAPGDHAAGPPAAVTLQAVLVEFADPSVSTADKTALIVDGRKRGANIDQMNARLQGYALSFTVADVSAQGNTATAQVTIQSPHGAAPAVPMTWEYSEGSWKLSDISGCLLLGFAQAPCAPA